MSQQHHTSRFSERANRYISHALVEVRRYKWLPFGVQSGVLLDISLSGLKIEFTGPFLAVRGRQYWLNVPLSTLGIHAPRYLTCKIECRWFDAQKGRMGGVYLELDRTQRLIIDQIIVTLESRKARSY